MKLPHSVVNLLLISGLIHHSIFSLEFIHSLAQEQTLIIIGPYCYSSLIK
jgi:hypothetical protein